VNRHANADARSASGGSQSIQKRHGGALVRSVRKRGLQGTVLSIAVRQLNDEDSERAQLLVRTFHQSAVSRQYLERQQLFIYEIEVDGNFRRRGAGTRLLETAITMARARAADTFVLTNSSWRRPHVLLSRSYVEWLVNPYTFAATARARKRRCAKFSTQRFTCLPAGTIQPSSSTPGRHRTRIRFAGREKFVQSTHSSLR
jgi:GNAT superfamily N-acetyltransferase